VTDRSHQNPLERALNVFVYGPVGVALYVRDTMPAFFKVFVARGRTELHQHRKKVGNQVSDAKTKGQDVVARNAPDVRERVTGGVSQARSRAEDTLGALVSRGSSSEDSTETPAAKPAAPASRAKPGSPSPTRDGTSTNGATNSELANTNADVQTEREQTPDVRAVAVETLPIRDYDELSASQVVERLEGLTPPDLVGVREYEEQHRGRRTILGKIEQLTS
jgi:hypothetical protein